MLNSIPTPLMVFPATIQSARRKHRSKVPRVKSPFDSSIDVPIANKVSAQCSIHGLLSRLGALFVRLGDLALTQDAFVAVAGGIGTGLTNVEWRFI